MSSRRRVARTLGWLLGALLVADLLCPPPLPGAGAGTVVLAADGTPLRQWPGADGAWRHEVTPDEVSPLYLQALLQYEDRWFRWHPGVNPFALARAGLQWLRHGHVVSGGSTLTMQVARIVDPPAPGQPRAWAKLRQIARALQLELRLSKREILTIYLNHAPMGGIVEGVEMASRAYLGKPSQWLSPAEAAMLAALPQAPSRLRPDRAPLAAQAARDKVLARLQAFGTWSAAEVADARIETVAANPIRARWIAPLAAERVRTEARSAGPLRSTLDIELQTAVERLLHDRVQSLPPKVSIAALVIDNKTLEVQAYAGSADFSDASRASHVDMARGVRSPGSALKPFLYAMALDDGLVHSESLMVDAPQSFGGYQPGNFQSNFNGPVSVSEALQKSLNVPAVDLLDRIGPARFAQALRAGGLKLRMERGAEPNLSLILGGAGTTLEELVGAYRALAAGGLAGRPRLTPDAPVVEARLMSAGAAFIVRDILEGGGRPDRPFIDGTRRLAWKTGTSFGFRDAWAVGVTDGHTLGVWVGRPDGTPNPGFFGANTAAPLLHDLVAALREPPPLPRTPPEGVEAAVSCWPLGLAAEQTAPEHCQVRRVGWSLQHTLPPTLPERGHAGGLIHTVACGAELHTQVRWPSALEPWVAPPAGGCAPAAGAALRITGVESGATLRPVPGRKEVQVTLAALGASPKPVVWLVDGRAQRRTRTGEQLTLRFASAGLHTVTALDEDGRHHRIELTVAGL